ncbi:cobalamin B12-binding domain-containing protein [Sporomusa acidovorans]|uniref:Methionine synthase n=1 Tax=Sporomusa acidovorans (strain ATCC 49682 / DSM 3132 / Mol) TaxID=1123286 RepID=A0ABZ3J2S1_SPOA4|nr:cobalamin-dependent protein [Sporomusa acidovorans]OZC24098.1 methionine synthase [Sporomusa acidovorans DSM 3132]SDF68985.1 Methanogenic corrinoid protein MtbC1 [Sporomusa acidovorans]
MLATLAKAITELDESLALQLVTKAQTESIPTLDIVEECRSGLVAVGERYSRGEYFLGDLILSSEIFTEIMDMLGPSLEAAEKKLVTGKVVFGTVEGDIHDIGKNLVGSLLRCYGYEVYDLGVDVPPDKFMLALTETGAPILCLCTLLSPGVEVLKKTVQLVRLIDKEAKVKILIGGLVNENVREYTGADAWVDDARRGVEICLAWSKHIPR